MTYQATPRRLRGNTLLVLAFMALALALVVSAANDCNSLRAEYAAAKCNSCTDITKVANAAMHANCMRIRDLYQSNATCVAQCS